MDRPDWKINTDSMPIDLSKNVHYDKILQLEIRRLLNQDFLYHDYPNQYLLYDSISTYYNIPLGNLTIGYGATEILDRIFRLNLFTEIYVVEPTFEMIKVYCSIYNKKYIPISIDELPAVFGEALYIANPSGNTGTAIDISSYVSNFNLCIIDEAYADFYTTYSMLANNNPNIILVKTLSKSLGIGGFRVGFCKASLDITAKLQSIRSNFICSSFASILVPQLIKHTSLVVSRMLESKQRLEADFVHLPSKANYVLFEQPNYYTRKFNAKKINNYYRMALADWETLTS
jgi:histidinol-phosphate aminotransferase